MNQLEQEKKLVAEFMGWESILDSFWEDGVRQRDPQTDRNAWPEIWDRLKDKEKMFEYFSNLGDILKVFQGWDANDHEGIVVHTASPEVCFKALIKTLEGKS